MMNLLWAIDASLTVLFSRILPHTDFTNQLFAFFSIQGLTIIIWLVILIIFFIYEERIHHDFIAFFFLSLVPTFVFGNYILKNLFERMRPWQFLNLRTSSCPADFSFPSSHAATAFAGAVIFAHFDRKRSWLYYSIATLIAYSRIYLLCHYLSDVVAGAALGIFISMMTIRLVKSARRSKFNTHARLSKTAD